MLPTLVSFENLPREESDAWTVIRDHLKVPSCCRAGKLSPMRFMEREGLAIGRMHENCDGGAAAGRAAASMRCAYSKLLQRSVKANQ